MPVRIYFDSCSLGRLTDNQSQDRVRIEAEAVNKILDLVTAGTASWVTSSTVRWELSRNPDPRKRATSLRFLNYASETVRLSPTSKQRAFALQADGYVGLDALHLALAEEARADFLITVDDRFMKRAALRAGSSPAVLNPVDWLQRRLPWLLP